MEEFLLNYAEVHKENMEIYEELNEESLTEKYHDIGIVETIKGDPFKTNTNGVANFRVHPSAGFTSSNKISVSPRLNHREWLIQC